MYLTVLGCRAGMPADGCASSGYLAQAGPRSTILLDCGPGVATALGHVASARALDAIVITHLHLDHCYDLLPIGKSLLSKGLRPDTRLPLYVPAGSWPIFEQLQGLFPVVTFPDLDRAFELAFEVREYEAGQRFRVGAAEVELVRLAHAAPNCGVRVTADGVLAYTGDTGPTPALLDLARDADLLLAECSLDEPDTSQHGHLCATDSAAVARDAGVKRLALTHFPSGDPEWLAEQRRQAAGVFGGPVLLASPFARFPVREAVS